MSIGGLSNNVNFPLAPVSRLGDLAVARRVADGGHRIPTDVVIRRYSAGIRNMRDIYLALADSAFVHDNSDGEGVLVVERREGTSLVVHDLARWKQIEDVR
jgi:predicted ABC-type ATPase